MKFKQFYRLCVLSVLIILLVSACESADTKQAGMDGLVLTDQSGVKWVAKHKIGDMYHLYRINEDGKINWDGGN